MSDDDFKPTPYLRWIVRVREEYDHVVGHDVLTELRTLQQKWVLEVRAWGSREAIDAVEEWRNVEEVR